MSNKKELENKIKKIRSDIKKELKKRIVDLDKIAELEIILDNLEDKYKDL